jgi:hypothetical protein
MIKNFIIKKIIDSIWKQSELKIAYNPKRKEATIKFGVNHEAFEYMKALVRAKIEKELEML